MQEMKIEPKIGALSSELHYTNDAAIKLGEVIHVFKEAIESQQIRLIPSKQASKNRMVI